MEQSIAKKIDHTLLKQDATEEEISNLCMEAKEYGFATVCVNPCYVPQAVHMLKDTDVGITTVIGFPLGATTTMVKVFEAEEAVKLGATEIDMVINVGALKDEKYDYVLYDIKSVVDSVKCINSKAIVKVILETCLLDNSKVIKACELALSAGADYVKTSTGFSKSGATSEVVSIMRKTVGKNIGVKASGGIKSYNDFETMLKSGASRIGCSSSVDIINQFNNQ